VNVLVVAPHPDDESIGCGGTIRLHHAAGERVHAVFLTSGELGLEELPADDARAVREGEAETAAALLGLAGVSFLRHPDWFLGDVVAEAAADLRAVVERIAPERILFPHAREWHPDHAAAARVVQAAVEPGGADVELVAYEVWTPMAEFDDVQDVSDVIDEKLAAVRAYGSQLAKFRYDDGVEGLNRFRGALAGHCAYAEVFSTSFAD
jgi:LmbE family N-acetylglucosaminyl deacetylase